MAEKVELKHNPNALWFRQSGRCNGFVRKDVLADEPNKTIVVDRSKLTSTQLENILYAAALHGIKVVEEGPPPRG